MISGQVLQNTLEGIRSITLKEMSVIDRDGKELAATADSKLFETQSSEVFAFFNQAAESQLVSGCQFFKVFVNGIPEMVVLIRGEDEETYRIGKMTAFHVQNLITAYKERFDRDNFVKNLLLDNLLLVDIYSRAKKLKIENDVRRVAYLIEAESDVLNELTGVEIIRNLFPEKNRDFVAAVDKTSIILIKEVKQHDSAEDIEQTARVLCDTLSAESMGNVLVSIGTPVKDLKLVSGSYKEARMAMEVGKIFAPGDNVVSYEKLGIGRLIYHMPKSLCKMFVNEVLAGTTLEQIDEETISTVNEFFRCSLNISETARKLIIHRNTLVYRLDRLQKITGLDLREFDDAVLFYITLMVAKFISYHNKKNLDMGLDKL
ncbi:MAG: helix-turn-helix domain-containing protein [Defluviitaleaceae bacterium]|nr:helix-turn-helix domain-containing protein [Defluviitaleaceae bacterium]MCL2835669.1 helix-turn-helix domain-containing protein [Defluviitaleaceae bacterium]